MRITTWNVNGLRAALRKGAADWWDTYNPDVLCLQEIRARPDQITEEQRAPLERVHAEWNSAQKPGYSGVATFCQIEPLESRKGMGEERFDNEGRVVQTRFEEFTLFNIYFPNGSRDHSRVDYKLEFYAHLLDLVDSLHAAGEQIIICGDFNTSHQEIDLKNHRQNKKSTGFLPEERAWVDKYLEHGFGDAFRVLYPEREQYTWWSNWGNARQNNTGWRLDYFLVSESLMARVQDVIIHDDVLGSDHCPVTLIV
ncbi:MAG: exodeoxyribonuclease III [Anaerolineales bacterium]|nr:exodeoxyribonuclease III [Chloroflexota bacterium]MBL6979905.1 exodeoxyribonuclease III [Anaerolineales bacterium]